MIFGLGVRGLGLGFVLGFFLGIFFCLVRSLCCREKRVFEMDKEDDMAVLALLRLSGRRVCGCCGTMESVQWRLGWRVEKGRVDLCNACGLMFSKGCFCEFCNGIYRVSETRRSIGWKGCIVCGRRAHASCVKGTKEYTCRKCSQRTRICQKTNTTASRR